MIMIANKKCQFKRLEISSIDNSDTLAANDPRMAQEETCLFFNDFFTLRFFFCHPGCLFWLGLHGCFEKL